MGDRHIIELLTKTNLFGVLSSDELANCTPSFHARTFAKRQLLFSRGDPGSSIFLMSEGQVRLAIASSEGRELSFEIDGPGDLFGEIAVLDGLPRSAEAITLAPTLAYTIERTDFRRLMAVYPALAEAVIIFLCGRIREISSRLEALALYTLEVRLARFLLGAIEGKYAFSKRPVLLALGHSQGELALLLGASRPKINMALGVLERARAIDRSCGQFFCDRARLAVFAQHEDL